MANPTTNFTDVEVERFVMDAGFTIGAETGGNTINVAIQLKDLQGNDLAVSKALIMFVSDNASGLDISTDAPSGGIAIGTDGSLVALGTNCYLLQSEADGDIDVNIVEAAADTWYMVLIMPDGRQIVSAAITFA